MTVIWGFAFSGCTRLIGVTIPNGVIRIGGYAFSGCTSLTSVTIPSGVTRIEYGTFSGCTGLTNAVIGIGVTLIETAAFPGCASLTSIMIPNSVTSIGEGAFTDCASLAYVHFQGDMPMLAINKSWPGPLPFQESPLVTVYHLPGTTGWGATFADRPTALWSLPYPVILSSGSGFGPASNGFGFLISWTINASVVVEVSPSLATPVWTPVSTNTLTAGTSQFTDPQWTNHPTRLYRLGPQ